MAESRLSPDPTGIVDGHSPAEPYRSPEQDKVLLGQIQELFRRSSEHRSEFDRAWDLFRLYLKGEQLIVHKASGELIRLTAEDSKRLRSVKNSLRPTARSLVGKLTRTIPSVRVVPPSNDFEDTHGAQVADALLQYIRRKEELDLKYQEACEFLPWAGNAYLHLYWDPSAGAKRSHCETCFFTEAEELIGAGCPQCQMQRQQELLFQQMQHQELQSQVWNEQLANIPPGMPPELAPEPQTVEPPPMEQLGPLELGAEIPTLIEVKTGDVRVEVLDPRDVYFEPGINCVRDARYVIIRQLLPVSKIRQMFPEHAAFIQRETVADAEDDLRHYRSDSSSPDSLDEHAYLFRTEEAPTEAYPQGRIIWATGDIVLKEIPHPIYEDIERFSIFHLGWDRNAGEFYFEPFIQQAWHRQRELNNNETAIREHMELLLRSKVLVPLGSRITTDEFSASSAQVIAFNRSAGEPLKWDPPPLPTGFLERGPMLEADIRQQAGITDADIGMQQSDPNGRAMAIIQAEADQQLGPITKRNNSEFKALNRAAIIMLRKFCPDDYLWTIAGPDGVEKYYIYEMNLSGPIDVELEAHDGASSNPALRLQQGIDLANLGYFLDPATGILNKKDFARFTKLHDVSSGYNMEATERASAAAIPAKIKRGEQVIPNTFDDPMIFAEVLLGWLRGPGRRADPMLTQQVEMIWQFYVMWAMTGAMPGTGFPAVGVAPGEPGQMMNPMMAQGGPGAGGPDQSAPGGSANNPGHLGSDRPIAAQAGQTTAMADNRAEGAARMQSSHEG
jgi:hypothetical protein